MDELLNACGIVATALDAAADVICGRAAVRTVLEELRRIAGRVRKGDSGAKDPAAQG